MKKTKAGQKAKQINEITNKQAQEVTGGCWQDPNQQLQTNPITDTIIVTLAYNEDELTGEDQFDMGS